MKSEISLCNYSNLLSRKSRYALITHTGFLSKLRAIKVSVFLSAIFIDRLELFEISRLAVALLQYRLQIRRGDPL